MSRRILRCVSLGVVAGGVLLGPADAGAQARRRGPTGVVVARAYYPPPYRPFYGGFYSPFYDPWFGPGWGWGSPWGWGGWAMAPPQASVRLDIEPRDAQVYVDGYFAGDVDQFDGTFQRLRLSPGQHEIVIYKDGYRSHRERLYLPVNSSRKVTRDLDRLAPGDPNEPLPEPAAAPDRGRGSNDQALPPPPRRGMRPGRVGPPPREPTPSSTSSRLGTVSLRVQPGEADIFIDGERWTGGGDDERLIVQLSEGSHQVEVRKDGYRTVSTEVQVRRGETVPVNISLSRD
ncbi:MAG: PEGA domain-containing protein [Acidimicrobiia bacterium]|nr:PEGA domain-containing protein [Acidimicrobiia bacterium]